MSTGLLTRLIRPVWLADAVEQRDGHANNFDIIRLVAASLVLISHAFPISGDTSRPEPLARLCQVVLSSAKNSIFGYTSGGEARRVSGPKLEGIRSCVAVRACGKTVAFRSEQRRCLVVHREEPLCLAG